MGQVIASTYEIEREIGSGGGGVVYLGRHLRLGKWVVLKADKRTLSAKPEALRREVDALKDLSHTYIPQVYDFVAESGVVYTVMDYIEGESLDKPLARGERFSQPQIIEWACELLEALAYLHGRPPYGILHGDLKPANIMLTPQGDIRLIDFNIALALGEEGAVQVGFSRGYASPEHYGIGCHTSAQEGQTSPETVVERTSLETVVDETVGTKLPDESAQGNRTAEKKVVRLDVRSDIYSLGATLYHLLSGEKPAQDAKSVTPLSYYHTVSPAVAAIVQKAMEPDPERRYQTAKEMLYALEHLHENDPRAKTHKRRRNVIAAILVATVLSGIGMTFAGLDQMKRAQAAAAQEAEQAQEVLAAIQASEAARQKGDRPGAKRYALAALSQDSPYQAQARKALADALDLYDLADGLKAYCTVELPTETLKLALSPEGSRIAALYAYQVVIADAASGESLAQLPTRPTAVSDFVFRGEDTLIYAGEGGLTAFDIPGNQTLWTGDKVTRLALSEDTGRVAGLNEQRDGALLYNAADGQLVQTISFQGRRQNMPAGDGILADPEDELFALNESGTLLAASFEGGGLCLFETDTAQAYEVLAASDYTHFEGGFYGHYFAFSAWNNSKSVFLIYDTDTMTQTGGFSGTTPFRTRADRRGICVASDNLLVEIDPVTGEQRELAYPPLDIVGFQRGQNDRVLVVTKENGYALYNENAQLITQGVSGDGCELFGTGGLYVVLGSLETPTVQILRMETHEDAQLCAYDPAIKHQEARLSADGKTVMLFRYDALTVLDLSGRQLARMAMPDADQVYDQQYRRDDEGSRLEVTWRDGTVRAYSGADGSLLWERQGDVPDESLHESFETSRWRVEAPLHGAATVYDKTTGAAFKELERESYLTYVTEVGDYLVTQYVSAQGQRYGLLLDQNCETLAHLPGLCDVLGETLIFDDDMGNLRQSRIYSLEELKDMAR